MSLVDVVYRCTEIPYKIAGAPLAVISIPIKKFREAIDDVLAPIFIGLRPASCFANIASGWIYNVYHCTLGLPQSTAVELITMLPHWKKYRWMTWCTESRLCLIFSFIFKMVHKPLLCIPIVGWVLWLAMLPIYYYLKLWTLWIVICPVRNMEAFLAPTTFPWVTEPGSYPTPL